MNVFQSQAFSMVQLTSVLLDKPHIPQRIGQLGIFQAEGVRTRTVSIEKQANTLVLVQTTQRGGPAVQNTKDDRNLIQVPTARIAMQETLTADEIQDVRSLGSETELETMIEEVNRRNARMSNSIEATIEFQRINALKGIVLDADNSTLIDLFATFGVTQQTEVAFDLANNINGNLRNVCSSVIRTIEDELGGLSYDSIYAMCSRQFYDAFVANAEYREWQKNYVQAIALSERTARRQFDFGGINFEEYRGQIGSTKYVADDKAHLFPVGTPELFLTRYAPAEWFESVNTMGLPRYAKIAMDPDDFNAQMLVRVQTQILNICTRPRTLIQGRKGA